MRGTSLTVLIAIAAGPAAADDTAGAEAPADMPASGEKRPVDKGVFGIGLILGEPTGVTAKIYLQDDQAIQIAVGSAFIGGGLQVHTDYVFHPWILQDRDSFVLPVYFGPGLRGIRYGARGESHYAIGLRGVIGLLFDFKEVPLDVFVEIAGVVEYDFKDGEGVNPALNAGAGVRYYF